MKTKAVDLAGPALVPRKFFDFSLRIGGCEAAKNDTSVGRHYTAPQTIDPTEHSRLTALTRWRSIQITTTPPGIVVRYRTFTSVLDNAPSVCVRLRTELDQLMAYANRVFDPAPRPIPQWLPIVLVVGSMLVWALLLPGFLPR